MGFMASCPRRILHLQRAQMDHAGLYVVRARLDDGTIYTSPPIFLVVRPNGLVLFLQKRMSFTLWRSFLKYSRTMFFERKLKPN